MLANSGSEADSCSRALQRSLKRRRASQRSGEVQPTLIVVIWPAISRDSLVVILQAITGL